MRAHLLIPLAFYVIVSLIAEVLMQDVVNQYEVKKTKSKREKTVNLIDS